MGSRRSHSLHRPEFRLGILLVHGIGSPPSGDTLVRWGDALVTTINHMTPPGVVATIERAYQGGTGARDMNAEAVLSVSYKDCTERWLLSEGRWAGCFPPPSYRELVSWSVRALPWSVAIHFAQRYWMASIEEGSWTKYWARVGAVTKLVIAFLLTPMFILFLVLNLLVGLLPIPQLRAVILSMQSALTATAGDSLAFIESPVRAALIKTRILDGLHRIKPRCEHTVILAHSQGAAAVVHILGGIAVPAYDKTIEELLVPPALVTFDAPGAGERNLRAKEDVSLPDKNTIAEGRESDPPAQTQAPVTLITFGAGTNQIAAQKVLSAGMLEKLGVNPTFLLMGALSATLAVSIWLYAEVTAQRATLLDVIKGAEWLLAFFVVVLIQMAFARLLKWMGIQSDKLEGALGSILFALYFFGGVIFINGPEGPGNLGPGLLTALATLVFFTYWGASSIYSILAQEMNNDLRVLRNPPGLSRWVDLYASADPVPNGPTRTNEEGVPRSVQIWNLGSVFADHTAYWNNLDGFVLRVVRVCAESVNSSWKSALPPDVREVDFRAAWRVKLLRSARWCAGMAWVVLGWVIWVRHSVAIPIPFDPPRWLPTVVTNSARLTILVALVVLGAWTTSHILRSFWYSWAHSEQKAVLGHAAPIRSLVWPLVLMPFMVLTVISGVAAITCFDGSALNELNNRVPLLVLLTDGITFLALVFYWIMRVDRRPAEKC